MSAPFPFELVSPEKLIVSGDVTSVQIPGSEGDFEVLAFHAPVMSSLRPGVLTVKREGSAQRYFVNGGFADANPQGLTVLADNAIAVEEMDAGKIAQALETAEKAAASAANDQDAFNANAKIAALKELQAA